MAQQQSSSLDTILPLLVLGLVVIGIITVNPGIANNIPILGDMLGGPTVDILIIGETATEANDWRQHLSGDLSKQVFGNPLNVEVITDNQYNLISSADWINSKGYDVVVLTAKDMTSSLQLILRKWVQGGGKLLVTGTGGTQTNNRWGELSTILPVKCGVSGDCSTVMETVFSPTMYIQEGQFNNGLAKNVNTIMPLTEAGASINIADVTVDGTMILYLGGFASAEEVKAGEVGTIFPGVAEKTSVGGGNVVYLSFNPTAENITPSVEESIVINVFAYMAGVEGYQSI